MTDSRLLEPGVLDPVLLDRGERGAKNEVLLWSVSDALSAVDWPFRCVGGSEIVFNLAARDAVMFLEVSG